MPKVYQLFFFYTLLSITASAQQNSQHRRQFILSDPTFKNPIITVKNDTIINKCDTLFIYTSKAYHDEQKLIDLLAKKNSNSDKIISISQKEINQSNSQIDSLMSRYEGLKKVTQHLLDSSKDVAAKNSDRLQQIGNTLDATTANLTTITQEIKVATKSLSVVKKERFKLLGSGFLAGLSMSVLAIMIIK